MRGSKRWVEEGKKKSGEEREGLRKVLGGRWVEGGEIRGVQERENEWGGER